MAIATLHGPYGVSLGATLLGGITQQRQPMGEQISNDGSSNEPYPRHVSLVAQEQSAAWTTHALNLAFVAFGILGQDIAALSGGLSLFAQQLLQGGTRAGASLHRKYNFTKGVIVWRGLSATHRGNATIDHEAFPVSTDGIVSPLIITDLQTLPTGLTDERFTIGPVTVGGISLGQVVSIDIDTGIQVTWEASDSDIYPTHSSIMSIQPVITLRGNFAEWLKANAVPIGGLAPVHADTTIFLKKRASGGTFVANGVAQHVKITANGIAVVSDAFSASHGAVGETTVTITANFDGSLSPLVVTPNSTIV